MRRNLAATLCSPCVPAGLALLWLALPCVGTAQVRAAQPVDITVRVFPTVGVVAPQFLDRDFRVSIAGQRLRLQVASSWSRIEPPVEAIVDLTRCSMSQAPSAAELAPNLNRMRKHGWHVDILDASAQYPAADQQPTLSQAQALNALAQSPAVHLVFVLCSSASAIPPTTVQAAERALAPVFAITPGAPLYGNGIELGASNIISSNIGQPPVYSDMADPLQDRLLPTFGPLDQPTLAAAIETAQRIRPQFFLLHVPEAPATSALHLNVRIRGYASTQFRILAQSYTQDGDAPAIILDNR